MRGCKRKNEECHRVQYEFVNSTRCVNADIGAYTWQDAARGAGVGGLTPAMLPTLARMAAYFRNFVSMHRRPSRDEVTPRPAPRLRPGLFYCATISRQRRTTARVSASCALARYSSDLGPLRPALCST